MFKSGITSVLISLSMFFIIQILTFYNNLQLKVNGLEYDETFKITQHTNLEVIPIILLFIGIILIGFTLWNKLKNKKW